MEKYDLDLTDDQELLRDATARFIQDACPLSKVRALAESPEGVEESYLRQAAGLGWFALLLPEQLGGGSVSGEGLRDAGLVGEERGRGLQPGPFVPMNVIAEALAAGGSGSQQAEVLPALLAGEGVATWAVAGPNGVWDPGVAVRCRRDDAGFVLDGIAGFVQDGHLANWLLVTAGGDQALTQFLIPAATDGITIKSLGSLDVTQRFSEVHFDGVHLGEFALVGQADGADAQVERQLQVACVLSVTESVGAMEVLFEKANQYALDRIAFGRPIGSFQAVKHQLADISLKLETAKAMAAAASKAVQQCASDAGEIASMAKAWTAEAGNDLAQGCFQVFGGIGYTWEHDCHLFLRRLAMNSTLFGTADWHRERVVRMHGI